MKTQHNMQRYTEYVAQTIAQGTMPKTFEDWYSGRRQDLEAKTVTLRRYTDSSSYIEIKVPAALTDKEREAEADRLFEIWKGHYMPELTTAALMEELHKQAAKSLARSQKPKSKKQQKEEAYLNALSAMLQQAGIQV